MTTTTTTTAMMIKQTKTYALEMLLQGSRLTSSCCWRMGGFESPRALNVGRGGVSHDCMSVRVKYEYVCVNREESC